jgi:DNA-binding response OmpR family regulator
MIRILLVEDDADLRDDVAFSLRDEGFDVNACADGLALDSQLAKSKFDVVVLDINLVGEDGLSILRRLHRTRPELGVIMLTARANTAARIIGMEDGADAYLCKPADVRELALVIHSVVRRLGAGQSTAAEGLLLLSCENKLITAEGKSLCLTPNETVVLSRLVRSTGHVASRRQIVESLGEAFFGYDERRLEAIVSRLRQKLKMVGLSPDTLQAVRGNGYVLNALVQERAGRRPRVTVSP